VGKTGRPGPTLDDYLHWQERLKGRGASGLSIDEFCIDEGVSKSTYYRWIRRIRDGIPDSVKEEGEAPTLAELAEPKFLPVSLTASPVEIELPNGGSVRVPVGVGEAVRARQIYGAILRIGRAGCHRLVTMWFSGRVRRRRHR
jgi:transposase-like protein